MLLECVLHEKYIEYLKSKRNPFEHEVRILNGVIDFKVEIGKKIIGVEVKADRSNVFSALGQLMNARRTFSDVYLLSTEEFHNMIYSVLFGLGLYDRFGFIILKDGDFITLSEPKARGYYFNEKYCLPLKKKKAKTLITGKPTIDFLERHKNEPFFCFEVAKEMKISMPHAQQRVARWRRFGLVEEIRHAGLPKPFRVVKIPKEEYVYL
jgi:hypothetical protein